MLTVTCYRWRDDAHTREAGKLIMDAYGRVGPGAGEIAHYINADGSGGVIVAESDDAASTYRNALEFAEFLDLDRTETHIVLTIEDALPFVTERISG
jgi:hypothetical protein